MANEGRSLKIRSPLLSRPVVMLKGPPDDQMRNGLKLNPQGAGTDPPRRMRCRLSFDARPKSASRSSGFAGKLAEPSLSLEALLIA